jgi:hypothetical protein
MKLLFRQRPALDPKPMRYLPGPERLWTNPGAAFVGGHLCTADRPESNDLEGSRSSPVANSEKALTDTRMLPECRHRASFPERVRLCDLPGYWAFSGSSMTSLLKTSSMSSFGLFAQALPSPLPSGVGS